MRITLALLIIIGNAASSFGQQEPLSSQFWSNYSYYNPANSGLDYKQYYVLQARDQWPDIEGNPFSIWAAADLKTDFLHGGIGLNYHYDEIGTFKAHRAALNYNFQLGISDKSTISLGIAPAFNYLYIDGTRFRANDPIEIDPALPSEKVGAGNMDLRLGAALKIGQFKAGLSGMNLLESEFDFPDLVTYKYYRVYHIFASHRIKVIEVLELNPNFIWTIIENSDVYQVNLNAILFKHFLAGLSYGGNKTISLILGIDILEKFRATYSYDRYTEETRFLTHSHELSLSLYLK